MFFGLLQKDLFKGRWSLRQFFSNKIIVTLVRQGLPSSLLARPVAYSHTKMAATVKNLTLQTKSCYSTFLWAITEKEGNSVDWESVKAKWEELNKTFIEKYHKNFQEKFPRGVCKQQEQQHFWLRDRPLEKLLEGGEFSSRRNFFSLSNSLYEYFFRP